MIWRSAVIALLLVALFGVLAFAAGRASGFGAKAGDYRSGFADGVVAGAAAADARWRHEQAFRATMTRDMGLCVYAKLACSPGGK